ncbi:hypothetical protein BD413DRAFT_565814 [Trametes elegans]|nr:hypothetical protein BD413DRAFT_565814 [Trametes elegans]
MDPAEAITNTLVLPGLVFCILYALSTFYNRCRTESSTYSTYVTLARALTHDPAGKWDVPVALYPQAEIYYSRKERGAHLDDPNISNLTQADGAARGVGVDLLIVLHHPGVRKGTSHPLLPKDKTTATINELLAFICDPTKPRIDSFDPTKYNVLQLAYTDILAFIELKPHVPRHCDISDYVAFVALEQDWAQRQAVYQFLCAMRSWRYRHSPSAWLIAGSGDLITVRYVTNESLNEKFTQGDYIYFMQEQTRARAERMLSRGDTQSDSDDEGSRDPLDAVPPFTDAEIRRYTEHDPEGSPYVFQPLLPPEQMEELVKRTWTQPMRLGSQVADICLAIVRKDISRRALKEVDSWDLPIDLREPPSFSPPTASEPSAQSPPEPASEPISVSTAPSVPIFVSGPILEPAHRNAEAERLERLTAQLSRMDVFDEDRTMELLAGDIDEEADRASAAESDAPTEPDPDAGSDSDPMACSGSDMDSSEPDSDLDL